MKDVSIVVVNWNTRDILRDCLHSVYEQTKDVSFEVIVVDNASTDGSGVMVKSQFPTGVLMENTKNVGFAEANNQAIKVAGGRYVLLLNSDTLVLDNAIAKTIKFADEHPDAAVAGCRVLNADKTIQRSCFMYPSILNMFLAATYLYKIFPKSGFLGREWMTWWDYNDVREVDVVAGCFMLVRREAVQQVGMLDNRYFFYCEETDWCYRFKKSGWKIMFAPDSQIIHYGGQTTRQMARKFRWQLLGSRLIFMRLHGNLWTFPLARLLTALFFLFRLPYWLVLGIVWGKDRKEAFETAGTCFLGGVYCLVDWKRLLMNRDVVGDRL